MLYYKLQSQSIFKMEFHPLEFKIKENVTMTLFSQKRVVLVVSYTSMHRYQVDTPIPKSVHNSTINVNQKQAKETKYQILINSKKCS